MTASRRDFLAALALMGIGISPLAKLDLDKLERAFFEDPEIWLAYSATFQTAEFFDGKPYDWKKGPTCSSFVGQYFYDLGFDTELPTEYSGYEPKPGSPMPNVTTVLQVPWLRMFDDTTRDIRPNKESLGRDLPLEELVNEVEPWTKIRPGSAVYFQKGISHHGYDTYSHTAVFVGVIDKKPHFFHYFKPGEPPRFDPLEKLLTMYYTPEFDISPSRPSKPPLTVYAFDAMRASRFMHKDRGPVVPDINSNIMKLSDANAVLTVNINDGTTTLWEVNGSEIVQKEFIRNEESVKELYPVVGRHLKIHPNLTKDYFEFNKETFGERAFFDGLTGTSWRDGVPRRVYTPPLVARIHSFLKITNFGNLGEESYTDVGLMKPLSWNSNSIRESKYNSHYSIHETPRNTPYQEILLREPQLIEANNPNNPDRGPLKEGVNKTSGCVNFDGLSWNSIKSAVNEYIDKDQTCLVCFSYPNLPLDRLSKALEISNDAFGGRNAERWSYDATWDRIFYVPPNYPTGENIEPTLTPTPTPTETQKDRLKGEFNPNIWGYYRFH